MADITIQLPEGFLLEEERFGYKVSEDMKKVWAVELDLLSHLMQVCDKNGITFYADGGTILGAVRHKGFIPWDDDIDVMMLRKDYERLCEIAQDEFKHPYFFQTEYTDKGSLRGHAQLRNSTTTGILRDEYEYHPPYNQGIFIDIFPVDNVPDDDSSFDKMVKRAMKYMLKSRRIAQYEVGYKKPDSPIKAALKDFIRDSFKGMIGKLDYEKYYRRYEEICKGCNDRQTERVAKLFKFPFEKKRRLWKREWFDNAVYLPFEMLEIPVPAGYKEILDTFYGDWHKYSIAPTTHSGVFFDTDISYEEFYRLDKGRK